MNCLIWSILVGTGNFFTAFTLSFKVWIPYLSTLWPRDFTCCLRNEHLLSLIFKSVAWKHDRTRDSLWKCSCRVFDAMITSSRKQNTLQPMRPERTEFINLWNVRGELRRPWAKHLKMHWPKEVVKTMYGCELTSSSTWKNPECKSRVENTAFKSLRDWRSPNLGIG